MESPTSCTLPRSSQVFSAAHTGVWIQVYFSWSAKRVNMEAFLKFTKVGFYLCCYFRTTLTDAVLFVWCDKLKQPYVRFGYLQIDTNRKTMEMQRWRYCHLEHHACISLHVEKKLLSCKVKCAVPTHFLFLTPWLMVLCFSSFFMFTIIIQCNLY